MAKDKPSFLQNIGDDDEEKDAISVLQDDPVETSTEEKPVVEKPVEEKPKDEKPVVEKSTEEKPVEEKPKDKKSKEEKPVVEKPVVPVEEKPLIMGKYKTQEEFEKAHNELQRVFTKLQNDAKKAGLNADPNGKDELAPFKKMAVIKSTIPDPSKYYFKNEKGEEVLDLGSYMKDTLNNFAIAVQQNLLGGPLAAAMFSILGKAIGEEQGSALAESKRDEASVNIWNNVQKAYPILGTDMRLQKVFERAIYGEKRQREITAQNDKVELVEMTEEDYIKLAQDVVGTQPTVVIPQKEDPVEKPKGDAILKENVPGVNTTEKQVNKDIDDMMATKRKSLF